MEIFKQQHKVIDFIGLEKIIWFFSGIICLISVISISVKGLNLSLEFVGGIQLEVRSEQSVDINEISNKLEQLQLKNYRIQHYGSTKDFLIRLVNSKYTEDQQNDSKIKIADHIIESLSTASNKFFLRKTEYVGSEVGEKLLEQGGIAVVISILVTMIYIACRFEFRLAVSAAITLCHNAIFVLGYFAITNCEFDLATLAAVLAVIGYSLNDTIVIFDRVRENLRKYHKENVREVINKSINQTLSRTLMTSILTLLVVLSLLFVGGQSLFGFALALTIGIVVGTYASICLAGSLAILIGLTRKDFIKR